MVAAASLEGMGGWRIGPTKGTFLPVGHGGVGRLRLARCTQTRASMAPSGIGREAELGIVAPEGTGRPRTVSLEAAMSATASRAALRVWRGWVTGFRAIAANSRTNVAPLLAGCRAVIAAMARITGAACNLLLRIKQKGER
jgi:hypothetical protein